LKRIIAIPTWRCNFHCSYCAYKSKHNYVEAYQGLRRFELKEELDAEQWLNFFSSISETEGLIDFTGGEPLLYSKLPQIIDSLPPKWRWAITSNCSLLHVVFSLNPKNCETWTASYHPESPKPFNNIDYFIHLLLEMKEYGYRNVACTIVYLPWLHSHEHIKFYERRFKDAKTPLNWHPYHFYGFKWDKEKLKIAKKLSPWFKPEWEPHGAKKVCNAGQTYFVVNNDGTVYPCYSHLIFDSFKLGNICKEWSPLTSDLNCQIPCVFPCDYLTNKIKMEEEVKTKNEKEC